MNAGGPRGTPAEERQRAVAAEVHRLRGAGVAVVRNVQEHGEHWVVMRDPESNEFCVQ